MDPIRKIGLVDAADCNPHYYCCICGGDLWTRIARLLHPSPPKMWVVRGKIFCATCFARLAATTCLEGI